jgi:hypothetical protein
VLQPGCQSGRADIAQSVDVLIRNSNLAAIPNTSEAVGKLRNVQFIVNVGKGPLSGDEYLSLARSCDSYIPGSSERGTRRCQGDHAQDSGQRRRESAPG